MSKIKFRLYEIYVLVKYLAILSMCYVFNIKKDVWLISERGIDARDNGYTFYKYMKKEHPEITVKYIISKKSPDRQKIDNADIINFRSIKHYIYFVSAKLLISTHIMGFSPETRLFVRLDMYNLVKARGKRIFLQHGVIYNEDYVRASKQKFNLDMFVCTSVHEYKYLSQESYFGDDVLELSGLARYDNYYNIKLNPKKSKYILVMPTWRYNISKIDKVNDFKDTYYFKCWNDLINDTEIANELEKHNIKLIFYPHHEFQKFADAFVPSNDSVVIAKSEKYDTNDLLKNASMLVTDYSSVFFDTHFMMKPVLYYQFDDKDFREYHHSKGWYDFRNGFGFQTSNKEKAIKYIIRCINNNFKLENVYKKRIEKCFAYFDNKNCERTYRAICRRIT